MVEKLRIFDQDVWVVVEPHLEHMSTDNVHEYFTASYHTADPVNYPQGILFTDSNPAPCMFDSPVQALAYAQETLLNTGVLKNSTV